MRRFAVLALATLGLASAARAEPAECLIEIRGRPLVNGSCDVDFRRDGGFTAEGKSADGALVTLSAFAEGRGRCWQNAGVKACAWTAGTRPKQR